MAPSGRSHEPQSPWFWWRPPLAPAGRPVNWWLTRPIVLPGLKLTARATYARHGRTRGGAHVKIKFARLNIVLMLAPQHLVRSESGDKVVSGCVLGWESKWGGGVIGWSASCSDVTVRTTLVRATDGTCYCANARWMRVVSVWHNDTGNERARIIYFIVWLVKIE